MNRYYFTFAFLLCASQTHSSASGASPHKLLAPSSWPLCHGDAHATDTSTSPGPDASKQLEAQLVTAYPSLLSRISSFLPVSLVFDARFVWGTSVTSTLVFEVDSNSSKLVAVDAYDNGGYDWSYHGAYSFVSSQGFYFSSSEHGFRVFSVSTSTPVKRIIKRGDFFLAPITEGGAKEVVIGVLPLYPVSDFSVDQSPPPSLTSFREAVKEAVNGVLPLYPAASPEDDRNPKSSVSEDHDQEMEITQSPPSENTEEDAYGGSETRDENVTGEASNPATCGIDPESVWGYIAVATSMGRVAVVAHVPGNFGDDFHLVTTFTLPRQEGGAGDDRDGFVSNSFAVDASGGIYVVSADAMHRIQWTPPSAQKSEVGSSHFLDSGVLELSWTTPYSSSSSAHPGPAPLWPGRLGRGSGSSPSLLVGSSPPESAKGVPSFAVVTDGASPMRLLVFRTSDGQCVGNATVTFGQAEGAASQRNLEANASLEEEEKEGGSATVPSAAASTESQSEQSVVVGGDRAVVVQNWIPPDRVPKLCAALLSPWLSRVLVLPGKLKHACSFFLGAMPEPGVEQFVLDLESGQVTGTAWVNTQVQCASSIPAASLPTNTALPRASEAQEGLSPPPAPPYFYCLGMRAREVSTVWQRVLGWLVPPHEFVVEALHWENGTRAWPAFAVGSGVLFNPAYAAVQVGGQRDLVMGTVGGVLRVTNALPDSGGEVAASSPSAFALLPHTLALHLGLDTVLEIHLVMVALLAAILVQLIRRLASKKPRSARRKKGRGANLGLGASNKGDSDPRIVSLERATNASVPSSRASGSSDQRARVSSKTSASAASSPLNSKQIAPMAAVSALKDSLREQQEARVAARISGQSSSPGSNPGAGSSSHDNSGGETTGTGRKRSSGLSPMPALPHRVDQTNKRPKLPLAFEGD